MLTYEILIWRTINYTNPASPIMIALIGYLVIIFLSENKGLINIFNKLVCKACRIELEEDDFDEQIGKYYSCLDDDDKDWSIKEEFNNHKLKMHVMLESSFKELLESQQGRCHLQGVHTYDILRNPKYIQMFQYVSPAIENREKFIKDGDDDDDNNEW